MEVIDLALILTAKVVIPLLSFGRWRGENLLTNEASINSGAGSLSFVLNGQRVITWQGMWLIGIAFYGLLLVLAICWYS